MAAVVKITVTPSALQGRARYRQAVGENIIGQIRRARRRHRLGINNLHVGRAQIVGLNHHRRVGVPDHRQNGRRTRDRTRRVGNDTTESFTAPTQSSSWSDVTTGELAPGRLVAFKMPLVADTGLIGHQQGKSDGAIFDGRRIGGLPINARRVRPRR